MDPVYVFYPRGVESGGPEALHQLVDSLRRQSVDAYLVPLPDTVSAERIATYDIYDAPQKDAAEIGNRGRIIIAETMLHLAPILDPARTSIWWLSIDMADLFRPLRAPLDQLAPSGALRSPDFHLRAHWAATRVRVLRRGDREFISRSINLAQSAYAAAYLYTRSNLLSEQLSDYTTATPTNDTFPSYRSSVPRVTFNPRKENIVTQAVLADMPGVDFIPIANMTRLEVDQALRSADIYLDLGPQPGKDRLPREAAVSGAIVVVAKRGAGAFHEDVPLHDGFKVRQSPTMRAETTEKLKAILADLPKARASQETYRSWILDEKSRFDAQVRKVFIDRSSDVNLLGQGSHNAD